MITDSSREENFPSKVEITNNPADHGKTVSKGNTPGSSSTPWLRLKDPRIVRVSRAFGGKDRHSKVCTVRGLRDRRVRLSVSTAIQLYDLQDRLGLNQPSKVVDWLLNVAKDEIDELPPLPIPSASIGLNYQSMIVNTSSSSSHLLPAAGAVVGSQTNEFKINNNVIDWEITPFHDESSRSSSSMSKFSNSDNAFWKSKSKGVGVSRSEELTEGRMTMMINGLDDHQKEVSRTNSQSNHLSPSSSSSFSTLLNNVSNPFGNYHMGSHGFVTNSQGDQQNQDHHDHNLHNFNVMSLPLSPLSLSTGSQIFLCPPGLSSSSQLNLEIDPRQAANQNHNLQMLLSSNSSNSQNYFFLNNNSLSPPPPLNPINQSMRPFHFSMAPKFVSPEKNSSEDQSNKNNEFSSE